MTDIEAQYGKVLAADGLTAAEIDRRLRVIDEQLQKSEKERWNRILTSPAPRFNTKPNAFLVDVTRGLTPGRALDVGMGQGAMRCSSPSRMAVAALIPPTSRCCRGGGGEAPRCHAEEARSPNLATHSDLIVSYVGARELPPVSTTR